MGATGRTPEAREPEDVRVLLRILGGAVVVVGVLATAILATWFGSAWLGVAIASIVAGLALIAVGTIIPPASALTRLQTFGLVLLFVGGLLVGAAFQWWAGKGVWFFAALVLTGFVCALAEPRAVRRAHGLTCIGAALIVVGALLAAASISWRASDGVWFYVTIAGIGILTIRFGPGLLRRPPAIQ